MTRVERMLHRLAARIAALEAAARPATALVQGPAPRKRECAPKPSDNVIIGRLKLWSRLTLLHLEIRHARLTKLKFTIKYRLGDPSDLCRFFSARGRGIPEGSAPALRYYAALKEAIAELETLRDTHGYQSHGIHAGSPSFSARPQ